MNLSRYPTQVFWSDEDEGFIALASDLPGCSAFGATRAEALDELQDAMTAWVSAAEAAGNPVPLPSRLPSPSSHSGKTLVRMSKSLHAELAQEADSEGVSLNSHICFILASRRKTSVQHSSYWNGVTTLDYVNLRTAVRSIYTWSLYDSAVTSFITRYSKATGIPVEFTSKSGMIVVPDVTQEHDQAV